MHELLLSASVPVSRYEQILNILCGIAAMAPAPILERHLLYRPYHQPQRHTQQLGATQDIQDPNKMARLAQQSGNMYYLRLVEDWAGGSDYHSCGGFMTQNGHYKASDNGRGMMQDDDGTSSTVLPRGETARTASINTAAVITEWSGFEENSEEAHEETVRWQIRFYDVPAPGKRPVTSRGVSVINVFSRKEHDQSEEKVSNGAITGIDADSDHEQQALAFMHGLGYKFIHQYLLQGHQFVYNNLILLLNRTLLLPESIATQPELGLQARPDVNSLKALDESGGWSMEATVRISDSGNPEFMAQGTNELTALRDMLRGCIDLRPVDRLALDTRVK